MKRIICLMVSIMLSALLIGCYTNRLDVPSISGEEANASTTNESIDAPETINGFERADFQKYNSYASENGLKFDLIYVDGVVDEIYSSSSGTIMRVILLTDIDGNKWAVSAENKPFLELPDIDELPGKNVRVFFMYGGFSDKLNCPSGYLLYTGYVEDLSTGKTYACTSGDMKDICVWIDEYGEKISYADYSSGNGGFEAETYFVANGIVSDFYLGTAYCSADFYERTSEGITKTPLYISGSNTDLSNIERSIKTGDGVNIYGYITSDKEIDIYSIQKAQADFTIDDVIADYKAGCAYYDYRTLARDPEIYKGEQIKMSGQVVQVLESGNDVVLRVNVTPSDYGRYEDTVYVEYTRSSGAESRILEDDIIDMYGVFRGLKTYETIWSGSVTIPYLAAMYIDIHLD